MGMNHGGCRTQQNVAIELGWMLVPIRADSQYAQIPITTLQSFK